MLILIVQIDGDRPTYVPEADKNWRGCVQWRGVVPLPRTEDAVRDWTHETNEGGEKVSHILLEGI